MSNSKRKSEKAIDISSISPYIPNLAVCAKINSKSYVKEWDHDGKSGQLFSCQLLDNSGDIRLTFFGDECEKFNHKIQVGKIYLIKDVQVKRSRKKYNDLDHVYELNATNRTTVQQDESVAEKSIKLEYKFENLKSISTAKTESCKDVIAIIKNVDEATECSSKKRDEKYKKKDVQLIDDTETLITLNLWGDHAENFEGKEGRIIVLKRAKINIYDNIVKLSTTNSTIISYDHECIERTSLEEYWKKSVEEATEADGSVSPQ